MWHLHFATALALLAPTAALLSARSRAGVVSNAHQSGKWRLHTSKAHEMEYTTLGNSDLRVSKVRLYLFVNSLLLCCRGFFFFFRMFLLEVHVLVLRAERTLNAQSHRDFSMDLIYSYVRTFGDAWHVTTRPYVSCSFVHS